MMLVPADVEAAMVTLLPGAHTRVPPTRPAEFTRVSRAGGNERNIVQSDVRLLVECFAADSVAAFARAARAWGLIKAAEGTTVGGVWISRAEMTEPVNYPDQTTRQARYQFVAQLTTSLQEIA